jgi:hypothetical protein
MYDAGAATQQQQQQQKQQQQQYKKVRIVRSKTIVVCMFNSRQHGYRSASMLARKKGISKDICAFTAVTNCLIKLALRLRPQQEANADSAATAEHSGIPWVNLVVA